MPEETFDVAARIASEALTARPPSPNYWNRYADAPAVSAGCIRDLVAAGRLESPTPGLVNGTQVEQLFTRTRVIDGTGLSVLRVSITPIGESGPCDRLPDYSARRFAGWDFANRDNLSPTERIAGIEGVWPLSEETLRRASMLRAFFLPAMKGFVDGSLIRRVTGYHLDLVTKRRWVETQPLQGNEAEFILQREGGWEHAWVNVPRGPIASLTVDRENENSAEATFSTQL